ncbi:unnamed protein product [Allacma fusca]|uniref:Cytochrome c oxidase subunit n=1 Tax=Allacma fusca TaxID=39272 RepID=A0A8J2LIR4_9HEXA|nr:unnamed protein product [Allacma fusca]
MNNILAKRSLFTSAKRMSSASKYVINPFPEQHEGGMKLWRNLTYFMAIPATIIMSINVYLHESSEHHDRPEFKPYEHLRIRNKRFPWGDGTRSLFHNPHTNPLPGGYEDE